MTKRTPQLETAVLEAYAAGQVLIDICNAQGISRSTVQNWRRSDEDFARRFLQAQCERAEALIDESQRLAEDPSSDWVRRRCAAEGIEERLADHIRHARLRIDTNLRIARILLRRHDAALAREEWEERDAEEAPLPVQADGQDPEPHPTAPRSQNRQSHGYVSAVAEAHARIRRGEPPLRPNPHRDADGNLLVPLKSQRGLG